MLSEFRTTLAFTMKSPQFFVRTMAADHESDSSLKLLSGEWLGAMRDQGTILGDLIEPVADPDDWEAA